MDNNNSLLVAKAVAKDELEKVFDKETQLITNQCIASGYKKVIDFYKSAPEWFFEGRGERIIPELKNTAVEFCMMRACDRKLLPFSYDLEKNARKTGQFLKLSSGKASLTINQTQNSRKSSRDAKFRKELLRTFTTSLNLFNLDDEFVPSKYYFEVNHGYQTSKPLFTVAGIPDGNHGWIISKKLNNGFIILSDSEKDDLQTVSKDIEGFQPEEFKEFLNETKDE